MNVKQLLEKIKELETIRRDLAKAQEMLEIVSNPIARPPPALPSPMPTEPTIVVTIMDVWVNCPYSTAKTLLESHTAKLSRDHDLLADSLGITE